jgi:hypothetical protein
MFLSLFWSIWDFWGNIGNCIFYWETILFFDVFSNFVHSCNLSRNRHFRQLFLHFVQKYFINRNIGPWSAYFADKPSFITAEMKRCIFIYKCGEFQPSRGRQRRIPSDVGKSIRTQTEKFRFQIPRQKKCPEGGGFAVAGML